MTTPLTPEEEKYAAACKTEYETACEKGRLLLQKLEASIDKLGALLEGTDIPVESEYPNYTALKENKWFEQDTEDDFKTLNRLSENLGIDTSGNIFISHHHNMLTSLHQGFSPQVHFDSVINSSAGMLAAIYTQSSMDNVRNKKAVLGAENTTEKLPQTGDMWQAEPKHIGQNADGKKVGDDFPSLKFWSDVAYLQWTRHAKDPSNLRCVLRIAIENPKTKAVVQHIMKDTLAKGDESRSLRTGDDRDHVAALLGTPNGVGVAWLLIQHKPQLGHKTVEKVTVDCHDNSGMTDDGTIDPSLVFHIRDVVAPEPGSGEVDRTKSSGG